MVDLKDSIEGIRALSETFKEGKILVRIEIDSGHNRCGVKPEDGNVERIIKIDARGKVT